MNKRQEELLVRAEEVMAPTILWTKKELTEALHIPPQATAQILSLGMQEGRIIKLDSDLLTLPSHMEKLGVTVRGLAPTFTVADFRRASELPRAVVPCILDWFDYEGITRREDDHRVVIG